MTEFSNSLLSVSIKAAVEAGKKIMAVYHSDHGIELKADNSPLTIADRRSHDAIMHYLKTTEFPVLSEEGKSIPFAQRKEWSSFWMVDPLDGTKEFIKKNGEFTVNIAFIENGKPVAGVIYLPVHDILYFGSRHTGSYMLKSAVEIVNNLSPDESMTDRVIDRSSKLPLATGNKPFTVVASRSHLSPETETLVSQLKQKYGELAFISKGSSIKICLVADGSADIYPRLAPTMEWDTAAGQAIAAFAGCSVTVYPSGETVQYNKENLLNPFFVVARN